MRCFQLYPAAHICGLTKIVWLARPISNRLTYRHLDTDKSQIDVTQNRSPPVPDQCQTSICRFAVVGLILLASHSGADHAGNMFRLLLRILAVVCAGMTSSVIWQDLSTPSDASKPLGRIWHDLHSGSLQVSEAVVSRFIDPCGLIIELDCTPFLWHPLIASFLGWPAGLIGCVLCGVLWFFGRPKQRHGRPSKRALSR